MEYSEKFAAENDIISGKVNIEYPSSQVGENQYISGSIEIQSTQDLSSDPQIQITGEDGVIISPSIISMREQKVSEKLQIYIPSDVSKLNIDLGTNENNQFVSSNISIIFDDLDLLSIGNELFREETFSKEAFRRQVNQYMESDGDVWPLINFATILSQYTEFDKFIEMIEIYTDVYPEIEKQMDSILDTVLKRALLGKIGNGRHHMQRLSQFESTIEDLSTIHANASVNPATAIEYAMEELDNNEELEDIIQLSHEIQIIDLYPEAINDKVFYILLSEEIHRQSEEEARNLVDQYFNDQKRDIFDQDTYQELKTRAKETDESLESQDMWYNVVSYAQTSVEKEEFRNMIAKLLYWTASQNAGEESYYYITPTLFDAAAKWFNSINLDFFAQRSDHEYHLRKGLYLYHNERYEESSNHLASAISISSNDSGEYKEPQPGWLEYPIIYKSLADAKKLVADGNKKQATELLKNRRGVLKDFSAMDEESQERIVSAIGGERFRIMADIFLREGDYERAEEVLERAVSLFKRGELDTSFRITLCRKLEVRAVLSEVNGDFEDAAKRHDEIAEDDRYSPGQQFVHGIRADVCRVKAKTREEKYEQALDILKQVNRRAEKLENETRELGILLRLLTNYKNEEVSDVSRSLNKISNQPDEAQSTHPLDVEYDYTEPIVVVLALERLNQTDTPQKLLDSLLNLSVQRALTPKQDTDIVDETYLGDISIDRLWRERLPSIVLNRIERIQLDSATVTGDYKSVTLLLAELLEFYLALLVEYHGKQYWGDSWRSELTTDSQSENNLSIGVLAQIFDSDAAEKIENSDDLHELYYSERAGFSELTEMRNRYDHAYEGSVSKDAFSTLQEWVFDFLRESVQDAPLIISVEGENAFGIYSIRLHWWRGQRQMLLETEASLEVGTFYYLPGEVILESNEQVSQKIDEENIFEIDDERVIDQIKELPKYSR